MNFLPSMLPDFFAQNPLPFVFLFLMLFGFFLPICEEIAVAFVGVALKATGAPFLPALALALCALLIQDNICYFIGRFLGSRITRVKFLSRIFKSASVEAARRYLRRRGPRIVFAARFVVGLRSAAIFGSGFLGLPWPRFALFDALAASVMTPAWLYLGFALGTQFDAEAGQLAKILGIAGPAAVLVGAFLIFRSVKADQAKVEAEIEAEAAA